MELPRESYTLKAQSSWGTDRRIDEEPKNDKKIKKGMIFKSNKKDEDSWSVKLPWPD